jgi:ATP-dependent RNA helicase RhlE
VDSFVDLDPALRAAFGHPTPTAVQAAAVGPQLAGRDVVAVAPTGSGKTAALLLPLLHRLRPGGAPGALVVAPTRELAEQTAALAARLGAARGLRAACLVGGAPDGPQLGALAGGVALVIGTPGRLLDLHARGALDLSAVEHLALDEADRLLDLGFLPDLRRLAALLPPHRTALFSATFPDPALADALTADPVFVDADEPPALDRIAQHVCYVRKADKHQLLAHLLRDLPRALVFTRTRAGADQAVALLASRGVAAVALHGDQPQAARSAALAAFRDGAVRFLVATDVAARGLHLPGLGHVVNFDLPQEPETYVHRVGRTGRAGATGVAISFCDPTEHGHLRAVEALVGRPLQPRVDHPFHDWDLLPPPPSARGHRARPSRPDRRGRSSR